MDNAEPHAALDTKAVLDLFTGWDVLTPSSYSPDSHTICLWVWRNILWVRRKGEKVANRDEKCSIEKRVLVIFEKYVRVINGDYVEKEYLLSRC